MGGANRRFPPRAPGRGGGAPVTWGGGAGWPRRAHVLPGEAEGSVCEGCGAREAGAGFGRRGGRRRARGAAPRHVTWRGSGFARAWRSGGREQEGGSEARGGHVTLVGAAAAL